MFPACKVVQADIGQFFLKPQEYAHYKSAVRQCSGQLLFKKMVQAGHLIFSAWTMFPASVMPKFILIYIFKTKTY